LRILNWIFALYFYRNSPHLTQSVFDNIIYAIHNQAIHVAKNINFSKFTVRNNHLLTEALCMYTVGTLFPSFSKSNKLKQKGKMLLEQESMYQFTKDGAYIQQSFNYERIALQLFTWALALAKANNDRFSNKLTSRLKHAVHFMYSLQEHTNGRMPNYGPNDGALFFPLNSCSFYDFRPQINALHVMLEEKGIFSHGTWDEDVFWLSPELANKLPESQTYDTTCPATAFPDDGYYVLRGINKFAFVRCAPNNWRPFQADNLHIDIWYKGCNILRDSGTYLYNTTPDLVGFFSGTIAHNTVTLESYDQMQRSSRFIWYKWSKAMDSEIQEAKEYSEFSGTINSFKHIRAGIRHERKIRQYKNKTMWIIEDTISPSNDTPVLIWNPSPEFKLMNFSLSVQDVTGKKLDCIKQTSWYSKTYGQKEIAEQFLFKNPNGYFKTIIEQCSE
jgi:hypothetical protein